MKRLKIRGRKWFDRINGNTYHTSAIIIDGELVHKTEMTYGYGEHYIQTAQEWLMDNGLVSIKRHENGSFQPLWQYCQDNGIEFEYSGEYGLKREL